MDDIRSHHRDTQASPADTGLGHDRGAQPMTATPTAAPTRRAGTAPAAEPAPRTTAEEPAQGANPRILAVQRVLAARGFGPLKADGYFGEETRAAIRRFERIVGLPQKGELTPEVLTALSKVSGKKLN